MASQRTPHQLPKVPTGLTASNVTATSVDLTVNPVSLAGGYQWYQDGSPIATTEEPSYSVTGLTTATAYEFYVTALDNTYNTESAPSNTINVTTS